MSEFLSEATPQQEILSLSKQNLEAEWKNEPALRRLAIAIAQTQNILCFT